LTYLRAKNCVGGVVLHPHVQVPSCTACVNTSIFLDTLATRTHAHCRCASRTHGFLVVCVRVECLLVSLRILLWPRTNKKNSVCAPCSSLTSKQRPSLLLLPLDCACTAACCPSYLFAPAPAGTLSTCPSVSFFATNSLVLTIIELTSGPVPLSPAASATTTNPALTVDSTSAKTHRSREKSHDCDDSRMIS